MNTSSFRFSFKPAAETQRALIHAWLQQDYIREWIHGQGLQNALSGLEKFFQDPKALTQHWIGYADDTPFVYLLTSRISKNTPNVYTPYSETEGPFITLDIFIGDPRYLGKGLAPRIIQEFLLSQFSGVTEVFIDPEKRNEKAVHVYQKVGFHIVGEFIAPWHPVPHHIMKLEMAALKK